MEEQSNYTVEITAQAEEYFLALLDFLYATHSVDNAERKADEILTMAMSLDKNPARGRIEDKLAFLHKQHRFLVYQYTTGKSVKILYFINEQKRKVYVTDFFGTAMDEQKIADRNI